jgi:hypothetical protein
MKQAALLTGCAILLGLALAYPAWLMGGEAALIQEATALGLCLVPAVGTSLWRVQSAAASPEVQLMAVLGGTGVRLAVVLGCGVLLYWNLRDTYTDSFWIWLLVFYLFTLGLEVGLAIRKQKPASGS